MRLQGIVEKGWGHENIWVTNEHYCSKFMHFKKGAKFSMHFHDQKIETWYVMEGQFLVKWINTKDATTDSQLLKPGDVWHNDRLQPHQLICEEEGTILEVSTPDSIQDNYRVMPGDSQA
jgi:mannose-6-phosphate isomerase-like protein (cupin superfamily)